MWRKYYKSSPSDLQHLLIHSSFHLSVSEENTKKNLALGSKSLRVQEKYKKIGLALNLSGSEKTTKKHLTRSALNLSGMRILWQCTMLLSMKLEREKIVNSLKWRDFSHFSTKDDYFHLYFPRNVHILYGEPMVSTNTNTNNLRNVHIVRGGDDGFRLWTNSRGFVSAGGDCQKERTQCVRNFVKMSPKFCSYLVSN